MSSNADLQSAQLPIVADSADFDLYLRILDRQELIDL
jgi:hypothetical protein